jgi:hypothetical protein
MARRSTVGANTMSLSSNHVCILRVAVTVNIRMNMTIVSATLDSVHGGMMT